MSKNSVCSLSLLAMLFLASCAYQGVNQYPLTSAYPVPGDLLPRMNHLASEYPSLLVHRIIGFTDTEYLPIYAIEIGKGKRNILLIGQHHADEVLGVALSFHLFESLAQGYQKSSRVQKILDEYKIWIVPTLNPEGWRVVSDGKARVKRKNNRDTDGNGKLDIRTDGVDLNRNYPVFWDLDTETNPRSSFYKGPTPASESEIKSIISLGRRVDFELAIFYHSSLTGALSERIFLPAVEEEDEDFVRLQDIADFYAQNVPRDYYRGSYSLHRGNTSRVGNARNFFYHSLGVPGMLIEIGGVNKDGQSIIHPTDRMVRRIVRRHEEALLRALERM